MEELSVCPVCGCKTLHTGINFAYCTECRWGEKNYDIPTRVSDNEKGVQDAITRISDYLVVNGCVVTLENISIRFSNMYKLDLVLDGMEKRGIIKVFRTANNEKHVALMQLQASTCDYVDVKVSPSDVEQYQVPTYRFPCALSAEQVADLRECLEDTTKEWIACLEVNSDSELDPTGVQHDDSKRYRGT